VSRCGYCNKLLPADNASLDFCTPYDPIERRWIPSRCQEAWHRGQAINPDDVLNRPSPYAEAYGRSAVI
jgi:hypothetical protein